MKALAMGACDVLTARLRAAPFRASRHTARSPAVHGLSLERCAATPRPSTSIGHQDTTQSRQRTVQSRTTPCAASSSSKTRLLASTLEESDVATDAASSAALPFVDTHCHLDLLFERLAGEGAPDLEEGYAQWRRQLADAQGAGPSDDDSDGQCPVRQSVFDGCLHVACSEDALAAGARLVECDDVYLAYGIHPLSAAEWSEELRQRLVDLLAHPKARAVGECGLDYHYDEDPAAHRLQHRVFRQQMELAGELGMPLVVHTREAEEDTLALMRAHLSPDQLVHVHCFTSSCQLAEQLLAAFPNLYIGFTGVVTFKNAQAVRDVVAAVPLDRMLLETDGPYMAPVPHRGKPAHPGHIPFIAGEIARVKGVSVQEVLVATRRNTAAMYGI